MSITDSFKYGFEYARYDYTKLLILGVFFILAELATILAGFGIDDVTIIAIAFIIGIIFSLIISGYLISVLRESILGTEEIPNFMVKDNFIDGIKYLILQIVYYIIPAIIVTILASASLVSFVGSSPINITNASDMTTLFASGAFNNLLYSLGIVLIIAIILFVIFTFFALMGAARFAKTGSLGEGVSFKASYEDIKKIGFGSLLGWIILLFIIAFIFGIIMSIIDLIPYVGTIISALIIAPFLALFVNASLGYLYKNEVLER